MDAADVAWLQSVEGRAATANAAALMDATTELAALRRLHRSYTPAQARAVIGLVLGRRVLAEKVSDAQMLFCDREAAEQTSHEDVSRHLARRFAQCRYVVDLGCGMGGDTLALAAQARVLAVDRDPARLAMLVANAEARGVTSEVTCQEADIGQWSAPGDVDVIWADPARRDASGRQLQPDAWSPPLARVLELAAMVSGAGIKLAPGIDLDLLPHDAEVEFVSLDRGLRAAVLWCGSLRQAARTATVLPANASLSGPLSDASAAIGDPGAYLYDPDPAVGRAGLINLLADQIGAWKLDGRIAYLTSGARVETPFARRLRIRSWFPFSERRLRDELKRAGVGRVEVMRRGSPVDTNALERRVSAALPAGAQTSAPAVVALTRLRGQHIALICERD